MKLLSELAESLLVYRITSETPVEIADLEADSRRVKPGQLFFCLPGHTVDGHDYAGQAKEKGAAALVVSRELPVDLPQLVVPDVRQALAILADAWYGRPSHSLRPIGVTGTNGKTTTTYLIERILADAGAKPGVIGTIEARYGGKSFPMSGTTPDALALQRLFRDMVDAGTDRAVMEVSSHALEQGRVKGTRFRTAIFTNLTQDHLDYHKTMEAYADAKGLFFSRLGNTYAEDPAQRTYAVLNADDEASKKFAKLTAAEVVTYGVNRDAHVRASEIAVSSTGTSFRLDTFRGGRKVELQLVGMFNVYNALAALTAALCEGIELESAIRSLESTPGVPGRVEAVNEGQSFAVIVDYAHTPDGLDNVLKTVREIASGRVISVFGCGGDRDRTKRPIMGRIAAQWSDYVIATSDNPRTEDPLAILKEIEPGLAVGGAEPAGKGGVGEAGDSAGTGGKAAYELEPDRARAIHKAVEMASPGDVVLIAGKGHETYQIIGGTTQDFDDRLVARAALRSLAK
ncbi:UDP-N-acetylmuramoyl-L-alanyl-D-glutamate--2,6-diaminopimelate ligase [Cohnella zeiphila]|uniref:UDP-N-acetylmuramoyl-L-alanyl-D-glutamate--2,6-diaminopimelate ligase n=1 Tax=Cohnella zeiphila TaxID=2761120 RepID=A0A7X0VTX2_9BACL|nr:UDP-N-acetylmuramoyl-L-alanyl-D-glutamate--2,6-diaminopimelate ligase [Cohnella zeiphila]MBB6729652.1 UDP-N-acetylmuramoyl-L-alanyl-D-glutamate--2,6-diaminopimelate ligase [Cohnella zeiphila]